VLYSLKGSTDGVNPVAGVIGDANGALYGTTLNGVIGGTVFKLTPPAPGQTIWTESVLYSFKSGTDGNGPAGGLIADTEGALYGTTYSGGSSTNCANNNGCGTVFKLPPDRTAYVAFGMRRDRGRQLSGAPRRFVTPAARLTNGKT
jgi:uncharacterized repeat protein (TIGR03803 family)